MKQNETSLVQTTDQEQKVSEMCYEAPTLTIAEFKTEKGFAQT